MVVNNGIKAITLDEKSFFSIMLGFTSCWDYKHYNKYTSQKIVNLGSTNKIPLKCDCIDGSVVDGIRQPILYSFVLDELPGYKVFANQKHNTTKKYISVLNTLTFYLENHKNEKVNLNAETLTYSLQMIKI